MLNVDGSVSTSTAVAFVVDNTAPTASVLAPNSGATVSGSLTLIADAADAGGVAHVRFAVDGTPIGGAVAAPYQLSLDTIAFSQGPHDISAVAVDNAGNVATSSSVTVVVSNDGPVALIPLGDSRTAILDFDTAHLQQSNMSPWAWANAVSDQSYRLAGNFGVGADTTIGMLERLPSALAAKQPGYLNFITIWGGVNDIGTLTDSGPGSDGYYRSVANRLIAMATSSMATGVRPIIFTESGSEAFSPSQVQSVLNLNASLTSWVESHKGDEYAPLIFDIANLIWNDQPSSSITFKQNYAYDGLHLQVPGSDVTGQALNNFLRSHVTPTRETPSGTELLQNTGYATATGGVAGSGVVGTVPQYWQTFRDNANVNSIAFSVLGSHARFVATSNGSNTLNGFRFRQDPAISGLSGGDVIEGWGTVAIASGATSLASCSVELFLNYSDATFTSSYDGNSSSNKGSIIALSDRVFRYRTPRVTIDPSKSLTKINYIFHCKLGASGTVTADFYDGSLRKVN
jgi:hypothetical protein